MDIRRIFYRGITFLKRLLFIESPPRSRHDQVLLDMQTQYMIVYESQTCLGCQKVRSVIQNLGLKIQRRDIQLNPIYREELLEGGGEEKVPCLKVTTDHQVEQWIYEPEDIILFLEKECISDIDFE